jgi:hypothetical protein
MNPFEPPKATVTDAPAPPGAPVKAVMLGLLVAFGGSAAFGMLFAVAVVVSIMEPGMSPDVAANRYLAVLDSDWATLFYTAVGSWMSVLGGWMSVLGGHVCARVARRRDYTLAGVLAACSIGIGLLLAWGSEAGPMHLVNSGLTAACVFIGYRWGLSRIDRMH